MNGEDPRDDLQIRAENAALRQHLVTLGDITLAGEIPLDSLLQRIVEASQSLLRARFAALGIFDGTGRVEQFFTAGLTAEERARIRPLPVGAGLLGLIVREPKIIRVRRIADHPSTVGFPPHHPPMTSFLGGPIVRGSVIYGNLYLTDRIDADEFSVEDEDLLAVLAQQAALAIENAQRFARIRREEAATRALFDISQALASLGDPESIVDLAVREARRLLEGDLAGVCLLDSESGELGWTLVDGSQSGRFRGTRVPVTNSLVARVIQSGAPILVADVQELGPDLQANPLVVQEQLRSVAVVPLGQAPQIRGILLVGWRRPNSVPREAGSILDRFADRVAIALAQAALHGREEAALEQSQLERSSLEAIFNSMADAVFMTDLAGRIVRLNRRAEGWADRPASEAIGELAERLFPLVDDVGRPASVVDQSVPLSRIVNLRQLLGEMVPVEWVVSSVRDAGGKSTGYVQVLRDLRPQREVEQLKANIISLVSHELRTPLSHIKGYASSLLQPDVTWDEETQRDFIASIDRQADRLGRLIGDLLEISRLDAGGTARLECAPVSPRSLVERGIHQALPNAADHPISAEIPADLPLVMADTAHIERVLSNLIENAAKYSAGGTPIIVEVSSGTEVVQFAVCDQGTGLTNEEKRHIFERFYRSPRVKHRMPGTGLGLAICKEIIQAHGGKIWAESTENEGSVFRFTLPRAK